MSNRLLKFGFHNFLNAQPVLVPLQKSAKQYGLEMVLGVPAELAEQLSASKLDLAMIPTIEYFHRAEDYRLVPDVCIASRGAVRTVLLATRKPLEDIRSLALDERSSTSVALLKILFAGRLAKDVRFVSSQPDISEMLKNHDAALIIGDQAFSVSPHPELEVYDLSEEWGRQTGKSFVHAVIAVRSEVNLENKTLDYIARARGEGLNKIDAIVDTYTQTHALDAELCKEYLENKIIYQLGKEELAGLIHFQDLCCLNGLLAKKTPVIFLR